jgi:hypothetical protein
VGEIRKLISRWPSAPILDVIRKKAVHASLKAVDGCASAITAGSFARLGWVLRLLRAGQRGQGAQCLGHKLG